MSKFIPNSYQTPNLYNDLVMPLLTGEEWKCLSYAVRRIIGFQKETDRISLSQFASGIRSADGRYLDFGTGLSKSTCAKSLASLCAFNLVIELEPAELKKQLAPLYGLQMDSNAVNWSALWDRYKAKKKNNVDRLMEARVARYAPYSVGQDRVDLYRPTEQGLFCRTGQPYSVGQEDNNQLESQPENQTILGGEPPREEEREPSALDPSTEGAYLLFNLLGDNATAKKRRKPQQFPTLQAKAKFEQAEERLGLDELEKAVVQALSQNITAVVSVVSYVAKWGTQPMNKKFSSKPQQPPTFGAASSAPVTPAAERRRRAENALRGAEPIAA